MSQEPPVQALATLDDRIHRNHAQLVAFLARRVGADAEELAQETWLRVARAMPDCSDEASFRGYTYTVARRLVVDHYRGRAVRGVLVPLEGGAEAAAGGDPHGAFSAGQMLGVVEAALAGMKPELAEVFRWRTTSDLSFKDIAARQQVSLNTALGRHHQATQTIRRALERAGLVDGETP